MSVCGEKTSGEPLEIEAYAARYSGRTKIIRLLFIAKYLEEGTSKREALSMAYDEIKKGKDVQLFRDCVERIKGYLESDDLDWIIEVDCHNEQKILSLQENLYLVKQVSTCYELGRQYYEFGSLSYALDCYDVILESETSQTEILAVCMSAVSVSMEMSRFDRVISFVEKAVKILDASHPFSHKAKLLCASGLAHLELKHYKLAALEFSEADLEHVASCSEFISPQDIAIYGGLCALATFNQLELKEKIIHNAKFQKFLDLVPEVSQLIEEFSSSCFGTFTTSLRRLKPKLLLDMHLRHHVDTLYARIRKKTLILYAPTLTLPLVTLDLGTMAAAFETTVPNLEKELQELNTVNSTQVRSFPEKIGYHLFKRLKDN